MERESDRKMTMGLSDRESRSIIPERERWLGCYKNKSIVVTGGRGFLGTSLIRALSAVPCTITSLSRGGPGTVLPPDAVVNLREVSGDIRDAAVWRQVVRDAEFVFHLAAQTSAYAADRDPMADLHVNGLSVLQLLETCRQQRLSPRVVFAGTVTQVGVPSKLPVDEAVVDRPVTVYDIHKLLGEKYLQFYAISGIVPAVILRLSNVYGPGPRTAGDRGVLNLMIRRALEGGPLFVYGDGNMLRDYIFVEDVVGAFLAAGANMDVVNGNYYVIGTGVGHRIVDAANLVAQRTALSTGKQPIVRHVPPPNDFLPIEARNFIADTTRFRSATGWKPHVTLVEGIDRTLDYYLNQMAVGKGQS